jgi:formylglycine-generating enzyme required for sulfatase activity
MCRHFDVTVPKQCREDDAEEVTGKERQNFCEWFVPSEDAFEPAGKAAADRARQSLDVLFGDADASGEAPDTALSDAEKLFD